MSNFSKLFISAEGSSNRNQRIIKLFSSTEGRKMNTKVDLIHHIFSFFGKIKSRVQYCKIKEEEGDEDITKLLNDIPNGDRQIWMDVETPIPSYAVIDGRRVKYGIQARRGHVQDAIKYLINALEEQMLNYLKKKEEIR